MSSAKLIIFKELYTELWAATAKLKKIRPWVASGPKHSHCVGLAECAHLICHSLCYYFSTTTEKQKNQKISNQLHLKNCYQNKIRSVEFSTHIHPTVALLRCIKQTYCHHKYFCKKKLNKLLFIFQKK
jgi:hypothetical protein